VDILQDLIFLVVAAIGLAFILLPVLPGTLVVLGTTLVWALVLGEPTGWVVLAVVGICSALGMFLQYAVPGRRLKAAGVPTSALLVGALVGVVGFFVVPVIGLPIGFVLGVFLAETRRLGAAARPGTRSRRSGSPSRSSSASRSSP
jgi:uncharacterized protein YqgC (DUF456 family)